MHAPPSERVVTAGLDEPLGWWLDGRLSATSIRAATRGSEALEALAAHRPSLLVLDHSLADPSALTVLSRLRASEGGAETDVIYCMPPVADSKLRARLVNELGVTQLMFHPIDRGDVARHMARLLGVALIEEDGDEAPDSGTATTLREAIRVIWDRHRTEIIGRLDVIGDAAAALSSSGLQSALRNQAEREAHKLAGSLGTFGFNEGSEIAKELELLFKSDAILGESDVPHLSELVLALRNQLESGPMYAGPSSAHEEERGSLMMLVASDAILGQKVKLQAAARGLRCTLVPDAASAQAAVTVEAPLVAVLDVATDRSEDVLSLLEELNSRYPPIPALVLSSSDDFIDRVSLVQRGARFLAKDSDSSELVEAATLVLDSQRAKAPKVLAVDDDGSILATLEALLEREGVRFTGVEDPLKFWDVLKEVSPDVLILDLDMPQISGIDLCRVVRSDPAWAGLPVLFLTANSAPDTSQRVFAAGADDYVSKPIGGLELISRLKNRLERVDLFRRMAETDPLTGVDNRRKSFETIDRLRGLSDRYGEPLSLGIIDLDGFKQINDQFGHASGDAVLRMLGQLLLRTFRGEDVVARWGGEEFAVGMYGMSRDNGVHRIEQLLETFRAKEFAVPQGQPFHVTFSSGVALYPQDGADLPALYRAADNALYAAKRSGRNRVLPARSGAPEFAMDR